ncbi:hypothetical protein MMC20_004178 [Loxospora ochrophaea]|nr:hypothetical protein [Loxospora ochrophaea]
MSTKIFATGVTGYVGGDAIANLVAKHPDFDITVLVRKPEQVDLVKKAFPSVKTIIGDLDSKELLASEAEKADIVLQMANGDHEGASFAIIDGLARSKKGTFIHMSGSANLVDFAAPLGVLVPKVYADIDDAAEILSLPPERLHAALEQKIVSESERLGVRTAILSPPMIFGLGRGPGTTIRHSQAYTEAVLSRGRAFVINTGENMIGYCDISDVSSAVETLVGEALKSSASSEHKGYWGRDGYVFSVGGETPFKAHATWVAQELSSRGLIDSAEIEHVPIEEVTKYHQWAGIMWGGNVRPRAQKLETLGWKPERSAAQGLASSLEAELAAIQTKK